MLTEVTCVVIACDRCGALGFDSGDGGDFDSVLHFDTVEEAESTAREAEWFVGDDHAVCRRCVEKGECELLGHDNSGWRDSGPHETRDGGLWVGRVRWCNRCGRSEYDPPVGAAHNDGSGS